MRSKKVYLTFFLLMVGLLFACEDRTVVLPGLPDADDDTVSLDFAYRKSTVYLGFVKFQLLSNNIKDYEWSFGFLEKEGKIVTSKSSGPGIFFPANGDYMVTLKGTDIFFEEYEIVKTVTITNFP